MRRFNLRVSSALERCRHIYFLCAFYGRVDLFCAAATPLISCCRSNRASSSTEDFSEGVTTCHLPRCSFFRTGHEEGEEVDNRLGDSSSTTGSHSICRTG